MENSKATYDQLQTRGVRRETALDVIIEAHALGIAMATRGQRYIWVPQGAVRVSADSVRHSRRPNGHPRVEGDQDHGGSRDPSKERHRSLGRGACKEARTSSRAERQLGKYVFRCCENSNGKQ